MVKYLNYFGGSVSDKPYIIYASHKVLKINFVGKHTISLKEDKK